MAVNQGALTFADMMAVWRSVTDRSYNRPLLDNDDSLIEVVEQMAEQFSRASTSIDRNTQAMFILPWSGQTNPPASGGAKAEVTLTVTRTGLFDVPILFTPGEIIIEHRLNDYGPNGPVEVTSNRRYVVKTAAALGVGDAGPVSLEVIAENEGPGYNEPTEDTLTAIIQPGATLYNLGASVELGTQSTHRLVASIFPDVPIPRHIGQYLIFTAGANLGQVRRIVGVESADPAIPHGGVFNLAAEAIFDVTNVVGTFSIGEEIEQATTLARGEFVSLSNNKLVLVRTNGTFNGTDSLTGEFGATADVNSKDQSEDLIAEVSSAGWAIMRWPEDLLISVTNDVSPTGGLCGFLDELGNERGIPRTTDESDDDYRRRISVPADVVSPGAVIRAGNSVLEPYGEEICLREVGRPLFRGMFYDSSPSTLPFAFDLDFIAITVADSSGFIPYEKIQATNVDGIVTEAIAQFEYTAAGSTTRAFIGAVKIDGPVFTAGQTLVGQTSGHSTTILTVTGTGVLPEHRFNTYLSLREFRGYFLVGVPALAVDDFGMFYDESPAPNAYDAGNIDNFFDGAAIGTNSIYSQIYNAIDRVRPAGVPFDLYIEDFGCV